VTVKVWVRSGTSGRGAGELSVGDGVDGVGVEACVDCCSWTECTPELLGADDVGSDAASPCAAAERDDGRTTCPETRFSLRGKSVPAGVRALARTAGVTSLGITCTGPAGLERNAGATARVAVVAIAAVTAASLIGTALPSRNQRKSATADATAPRRRGTPACSS
jgi:hypothetical protein